MDRVGRKWLDDPEHPQGGMERLVEATLEEEKTSAEESGDGVVRWKHRGDRQEVLDFCTELVSKLEPILRQELLPYDWQTALRFKVPVTVPYLDGTPTQINLSGELDYLVRTPTGWRIWDLKATRDDSYWRKTMGQLVFYDLMVQLRFGESTEKVGLIQPLCKQRIVSWEVDLEQRRALMRSVISMATDIWQNEFPVTENSSNCFYCNVKHACPKYARGLNLGGSLDELRSTEQQESPVLSLESMTRMLLGGMNVN